MKFWYNNGKFGMTELRNDSMRLSKAVIQAGELSC